MLKKFKSSHPDVHKHDMSEVSTKQELVWLSQCFNAALSFGGNLILLLTAQSHQGQVSLLLRHKILDLSLVPHTARFTHQSAQLRNKE